MSYLSNPIFHDEQEAYNWVEARVWPEGAQCPKCGEKERVSKMKGKSSRIGAYKCYKCRKPFTVKVGTIFEASHVKMNLWLQAIYLMVSSKKGISSHQLHRTLGVTVKTAWFMTHRIREAMRDGNLDLMGGDGGPVEADETYFGHRDDKSKGKITKRGKRGHGGKRPVVALVERGGSVRSFYVSEATTKNVSAIVAENISKEAVLNTDESRFYTEVGKQFKRHDTVHHSSNEYARYLANNEIAHTNTVEGYFSVFKRGMKGVYQHCKEKHLHRYLAEFDFRYNNRVALKIDDKTRFENIFSGVKGKRLTYQTAY